MFSIGVNQCCCQRISIPKFYSKFKNVKTDFKDKSKSLRMIYTSQIFNQDASINIFDRQTKIHQKNIAARYPDQEVYDYIKSLVRVTVIFYIWSMEHGM